MTPRTHHSEYHANAMGTSLSLEGTRQRGRDAGEKSPAEAWRPEVYDSSQRRQALTSPVGASSRAPTHCDLPLMEPQDTSDEVRRQG